MKTTLLLLLAFGASSVVAQHPKLSDWPSLLDKKEVSQARALCEQYARSQVLTEQVEAQKCLANVALCGKSELYLEGNDSGGGTLRGAYEPSAVDEALKHLDLGIQLAPQDLSIHQGRLHVLEVSGRYDAMIKALDESATIYKGSDALDAWMAYAPELADLGQYQAGLDFTKVLQKHFPSSPDVIGNIGAFLSMMGKTTEAIPYLEQAAALAPKDPINAWDLGRAYNHAGQIQLADEWYRKGLSLDTDPERKKQSGCLYAQFVENSLKDRARACKLEVENCDKEQQTACAEAIEPGPKP